MEGLDEIIDDFVIEAAESLDSIDPKFVALEEHGYDNEILNDIFRSMHTVKGAAGFLGFQPIVDVAHAAESIMKMMRDGDMKITTPVITVILKSVDMLRLLLSAVKARDGSLMQQDIGPLLAELSDALAEDVHESPVRKGDPLQEEPVPQDEHVDTPEPSPLKGSARKHADELMAQFESELAEDMAGQATVSDSAVSVDEGRGAQAGAKLKSAPEAMARSLEQTLRVDVQRIDKVMNLTGEIVLVRNRLLNIGNNLEKKYSSDEHVEGLQETVAFLDLVTSDIQLAVMKMRMQPIKKVFGKFPRLVRDISQSLGKDVQLSISGEGTEVDRSVIERIGDPMIHIIRNAIDHGIEPPEVRKKQNKPEKGHVDIAAYQQGSHIIIEVTDDGRGIDIELVKKVAVRKGIISKEDAEKLSDKDATNFLFQAGFSTVKKATELSGRGVGMDVVKTNIAKLNGYVEIISTKGVGTTFRISIPLTLAIIQALMVRASGVQYAIPLSPIEETLKITQADIDNVTGNKVLAIRDKVIPLSELSDILGFSTDETPDKRYVLVIAIGERRVCIAVDELLGQEEVVIKAIEGIDTDQTGILGATITGEGNIVLILDPAGLSRVLNRSAV